MPTEHTPLWPAKAATAPAHWLARGLGTPAVTPVALLLVMALALWLLGRVTTGDARGALVMMLVPLLGVAAGCVALARVRR